MRKSLRRKSSEVEDADKLDNENMNSLNDASSSELLTPPSTPCPPPATESDDDEPTIKKKKSVRPKKQYEVEKIVGYHIEEKDGGKEIWYLIKWKGYSTADNTWELADNLTGCNKMLMEFFEGKKVRQSEIKAMEKQIAESLADYPIYRKLEESSYHKKYLDEFSKNLDLTGLFRNKSIKPFVDEAKKQYSYVVRTLAGMYKHRDERMFKRGQNYKILLKICDLRQQQLENLNAVEKKINSLEKCLIKVENTVDLEHFPQDLEYITKTIYGKDVVTTTEDFLAGCECKPGCSIKSKCCGSLSEAEFAYNKDGTLRLPNHSAIYECNSRCSCGKDCPNRVVQNGRKFKLSIFKTESCGWGVKTLENIPKGSFVCEYVGELIKDSEASVRDIEYCQRGVAFLFDLDFNEDLKDEDLHCVDATHQGNFSRFINHSCDPNLIVYPVWIDCLDANKPRLAFFTKKEIKKNEEIHFDYECIGDAENAKKDDRKRERGRGSSSVGVVSKIKCQCKSTKCHGLVFGNR